MFQKHTEKSTLQCMDQPYFLSFRMILLFFHSRFCLSNTAEDCAILETTSGFDRYSDSTDTFDVLNGLYFFPVGLFMFLYICYLRC